MNQVKCLYGSLKRTFFPEMDDPSNGGDKNWLGVDSEDMQEECTPLPGISQASYLPFGANTFIIIGGVQSDQKHSRNIYR